LHAKLQDKKQSKKNQQEQRNKENLLTEFAEAKNPKNEKKLVKAFKREFKNLIENKQSEFESDLHWNESKPLSRQAAKRCF
jgi:hypothetical protein